MTTAPLRPNFLDNVTRMAIGSIMVIGFTTGIDDEDIPPEHLSDEEDLKEAIKGRWLVEAYREASWNNCPGAPWMKL